jgi:Ser/Thr protein kinase RdoA (MazF antagonist)
MSATFPFMTSPSIPLSQAHALFQTPPPVVSAAEAAHFLAQHYGAQGELSLLSGERDTNYRVRLQPGSSWVLKFINRGEPVNETDMQIEALKHLEKTDACLSLPQAVRDLSGAHAASFQGADGRVYQARCYTFVEGEPALKHPVDDALRYSAGRTAALVSQALQGFSHPAAKRHNLWDLCRIGELRPLLVHQTSAELVAILDTFMLHFEHQVVPQLDHLPHQVIHNDLSRSNTVVATGNPHVLSGVLDFGDMIHAPRLAELAVAASYFLDDGDAQRHLGVVVDGFTSITPLSTLEFHLLPDFVMARLVSRILISQWRARQFPANRDYLLRSNLDAQQRFTQLYAVWQGESNRHPKVLSAVPPATFS